MPVTSPLVRFGVFELDLGTGELSKNGRKLRLQEQSFRLLRLLLEQPGEAVPRERLKEALWPADTYVDFDHGLNAAVAKLRLALGDSAENPRFIETLARRGYRFIAPVEFVGDSTGTGTAEPAVDAPVQAAPVATKKKWIHFLVYGTGVLTLTGIALWFWNRKPPGETELVRLTEDTGLTTDPAVSPDGKFLAYASDRGSNGILNIWIQQLGPGGGAVRLTRDSVDVSEPAFSPDGTRIAFYSKKSGGGIYTVPVIGGEPTRLTQSGRHPRFSPNGRWISYVSVATDSIVSAAGAVYIVPSSGGEARRLAPDLLALA
jgi:DNA-binding winged helix-turn-helix (wHTH) protein